MSDDVRTSGNESCACGGNDDWDYHSPEGCGATAQAASMARSDWLVDSGDEDE